MEAAGPNFSMALTLAQIIFNPSVFLCSVYSCALPSGWSELVRQGSSAAGTGDLNAENHAARLAARWPPGLPGLPASLDHPTFWLHSHVSAVLGLKILREKAYVYDPTFPCPVVMHDGNKRR